MKKSTWKYYSHPPQHSFLSIINERKHALSKIIMQFSKAIRKKRQLKRQEDTILQKWSANLMFATENRDYRSDSLAWRLCFPKKKRISKQELLFYHTGQLRGPICREGSPLSRWKKTQFWSGRSSMFTKDGIMASPASTDEEAVFQFSPIVYRMLTQPKKPS